MENRIKECQLDLFADRTSAATMRANQLRLWFASMAYVLVTALRRIGLAGTELATATCGSIRLKLLKIGALVTHSVRRIRVAMASSCPDAAAFRLAHARFVPLTRNRPAQPPAPPTNPQLDRADAKRRAVSAAALPAHGRSIRHLAIFTKSRREKCGLTPTAVRQRQRRVNARWRTAVLPAATPGRKIGCADASVQNFFALSLTRRRLRRLRSSPRGAAPCSCTCGSTTGSRRCAGAWPRRG